MRITIDAAAMATAEVWAKRSTCPKRAVGVCITTQDGRVLAVGYNGAPRGMPHCTEVGCAPNADGECTNAVHAEANAIAVSARNGVSLQGAIMYSTCYPCARCAQMMVGAGIAAVVYRDLRSGNTKANVQSTEIMTSANMGIKPMKEQGNGTAH